MSRDGVFIPALARLHPRFGTPHRAILLQAGWAVVLVLTGTYGGLVDSVVFADWIFFALTVAGVIRLRRRIPLERREPGCYRSPAYPLFPMLFLAASALVLAGVVRLEPAAVRHRRGPARRRPAGLPRLLGPGAGGGARRMTTARSPYMEWAKGRPKARIDLAGSNLRGVPDRGPARSGRSPRPLRREPGRLPAPRRRDRGSPRRLRGSGRDRNGLLGRELPRLRRAARARRRGARRVPDLRPAAGRGPVARRRGPHSFRAASKTPGDLDPAVIASSLTPRTRLVMISNPAQSLGNVASRPIGWPLWPRSPPDGTSPSSSMRSTATRCSRAGRRPRPRSPRPSFRRAASPRRTGSRRCAAAGRLRRRRSRGESEGSATSWTSGRRFLPTVSPSPPSGTSTRCAQRAAADRRAEPRARLVAGSRAATISRPRRRGRPSPFRV